MAWQTPKTWASGEMLTAALLNEQLRDNMVWLRSGPRVLTIARDLTPSSSYVRTNADATFTAINGSVISYDVTPATNAILILVGISQLWISGGNSNSTMQLGYSLDDGASTSLLNRSQLDWGYLTTGTVSGIPNVTPNTPLNVKLTWAGDPIAPITLQAYDINVMILDVGV